MTRELMVKEATEEFVLEYNDEDKGKMDALAAAFTNTAVNTIGVLGSYRNELDAPADEGSKERMAAIRQDIVYAVADLQAAASTLANFFHVDMDEAFQRFVDAVKAETQADLSGL